MCSSCGSRRSAVWGVDSSAGPGMAQPGGSRMLSKRVVVVVVAVCCLFALTPSALLSQSSTSGLVTGTVTDPTGASVPGATVTLEQAGTGAKLTTTTSNTGHYVVPPVPSPAYTLLIQAKGFRTAVITQPA